MPNPFFSARIPQDLFEKIEKHIAETGESKTQILIKALAAYVNHPVEMQKPTPNGGVSLEMFAILEERVAALEQLLQDAEPSVIKRDNGNNDIQPTLVISGNHLDNVSDPWLDIPEALPNTLGSSPPPTTNSLNLQPDTPKLLPAVKAQQETENHLDSSGNAQLSPSTYALLTSPELRELTGMTQPQVDRHKRKVNENHKKFGQPLEKRKLLESPEKITTNKSITVNGSLYDLFYAGQNEKGKDVWSLILSDNTNYQLLSLQPLENS
jgi:hypothetical protein